MNRRGRVAMETMAKPTTTTTTTTTTTKNEAAATTPTTSALLQESRQLLLKQQLKLQLNINVSEMMDNLRRNVDLDDHVNYTLKPQPQNDGDLTRNLNLASVQEEAAAAAAEEYGQNKLDTVTTVPQLQQKFNKFNIIDEAAAAAITTTSTAATTRNIRTLLATTSSTTLGVAVTTSSSASSSTYTSLTQKQPLNTALAKFNRIIDNTVPVINNYQQQQQQHVALTLAKSNTSQQQQQHPTQQPQQQQQTVEMPLLSDSLKRRLASHHYTDLIVNNSKINYSYDSTTLAAATSSQQNVAAPSTTSSLLSSQQQLERTEELEQLFNEDNQLKRNDVHYLLKQLNSFSDIEEIEIVDMKQKQRQQQQQQLIRDKQEQLEQQTSQQQQQQYTAAAESLTIKSISQPKHAQHVDLAAHDLQQQHVPSIATISQHVAIAAAATSAEQFIADIANMPLPTAQYVADVTRQVSDVSHISQHVASLPSYLAQHVATSDHALICVATTQQFDSQTQEQQHIADAKQQAYVASESKQHFQASSSPPSSPTATSLVIYSPSSQSHKGIRRYASLHQQDTESQHHVHHPHHPRCHHPHHTHHPNHPHHHSHMPHGNYSEGSILDSAAAAAACDPLALQQFVDDYIFQSCHYLETNNFAANYCTAMVESSSHEFRPSTTTTTRTSNEEYDDEECYVEDHSSAHSFELHECEPPTVICKAPAPAPANVAAAPAHIRASMRHLIPFSTSKLHASSSPPQYTMETRLCSSGVQTDLTASSLAQSFSLSSSLSSTEQRKRRQPIFKCCYTPLDRWCEKRQQHQQQQQQQIQLRKRTKTVTNGQSSSSPSTCLKHSSVAAVVDGGDVGGGSHHRRRRLSSSTTTAAVGGVSAATTSLTTTSIVVHSQHHSLTNKNAPYAV